MIAGTKLDVTFLKSTFKLNTLRQRLHLVARSTAVEVKKYRTVLILFYSKVVSLLRISQVFLLKCF